MIDPMIEIIPNVSILMPIRNEARYIQRSLEAVLKQDFPLERMEILVMDGMSIDGTRAIIQSYQSKYPNLKLIENPSKIVPTGMNRAIDVAQGEIIIRVDGHCEIATDYVRRCVDYLQQDVVDGVGGPIQTIGETPLSETIAIAMGSKFGVGNSAFRTESGITKLVDSVPFPAYTREIVQKAGFYDEEFRCNEDDEYSYRLLAMGAKLLLAADLHSKYYSRGTLRKLWKQYLQYGYWKVRVLQKHPRQMQLRQFIPAIFIASLIGALALAVFTSFGLWLLAGIIGAYLVANIVASLITAMKAGWKHLLLLPIIFAILHVSYGLGFLGGLVKFVNRWDKRRLKPPLLTERN